MPLDATFAPLLPERAWLPTQPDETTYEIDEQRHERLRDWEFPHTHTWRRDRSDGTYAVDAAGNEIDRELTKSQLREKKRREEMERFRNDQAA
jgi:hypothetical protein